MQDPGTLQLFAAAVAAFFAGAINSVAGGGTLISFPTLIALGLPSVTANATSTVAIWPGTLGSVWGFRREVSTAPPSLFLLALPSVAGGAIGALLLRMTPVRLFDHLVPFLILFATILFTAQAPIQRRLKLTEAGAQRSRAWLVTTVLMQFLVAVYGGYFGAAMSIMMLTVLSLIGLTDILQMNGLTSLFGMCVNGVAAALFIWSGMVYWPYVVVMALAAIVGGYGAAGVARRIGRVAVRRFVIAVGFAISLVLFIRIL